MQTGAVVAAILIGVVIVFQVGLALGAPWGAAAWGGQNPGRLPGRLRIASLVASVLLALIAWVVAAAGNVVATSPLPESWLIPATWFATGYFGLGVVVNLISRSRIERLWSPVSLITAVCCAIVAIG